MKKIVFFVFLITAFVLSSFCTVSAGVNDGNNYGYEEFFQMLGIEAEISDSDAPARAEFTHLLIQSLNSDDSEVVGNVFSDLTEESKYAQSVIKAYELGIVSGAGDGKFNPESPITANTALKMTVCALGYDDIAKSYGGYPTGYHRVASEVGITDGMSIFGDTTLSIGEVRQLIFNFLNSKVYIPDTLSDDWITYNKNSDETPLSVYFGLKSVEGIAETAGYATMIQSAVCPDSSFFIDGESFKTSLPDAQKYLGMRISAWYDEETREVKAVCPHESNNIHTVNIGDIICIESGKIRVYDEKAEKEKTFSVLPSMVFVKNGRRIDGDKLDFAAIEGTVTLIDNNGDSRADVALVKASEHMTVQSVDYGNSIIYTAHNKIGYVNAGSEDDCFCCITDSEGNALSLSDVKPQNVISVFRSEDGKYCEIKTCNKIVRGKVSEKGDKFFIIDSEKYKINSCFDGMDAVKAGGEYSFRLAFDNTVTSVLSDSKVRMKYGYVLGFANNNSKVYTEIKLSVLTSNGEIIYPKLAETVLFNGDKLKKDSKLMKDAFVSAEGNFLYQVIRYSLDSSSEISKIDTALICPPDASYETVLGNDEFGDNTLTKFLSYHNSYWYNGYNAFAPNTIVGSDTVIFSVPSALAASPFADYAPEDFSVISTGELSSWGAYRIDTYDVDKFLIPGVIVVYNPNAGTKVQVAETAPLCLVESVRDAVTDDGEETKSVVYYSAGNYNKRNISVSKYKYLISEVSSLKSGDIIRVATDSNGEIVGLKIDAVYNPESGKAVFVPNYLMNRRYDTSYYAGKSYLHSDSAMTVLLDPSTLYNADPSYPVMNGIAAFTLDPAVSVAIYNSKTGKVTHADLGSVADILSVGEDNASELAIKCYFHRIQQIFIYE